MDISYQKMIIILLSILRLIFLNRLQNSLDQLDLQFLKNKKYLFVDSSILFKLKKNPVKILKSTKSLCWPKNVLKKGQKLVLIQIFYKEILVSILEMNII